MLYPPGCGSAVSMHTWDRTTDGRSEAAGKYAGTEETRKRRADGTEVVNDVRGQLLIIVSLTTCYGQLATSVVHACNLSDGCIPLSRSRRTDPSHPTGRKGLFRMDNCSIDSISQIPPEVGLLL